MELIHVIERKKLGFALSQTEIELFARAAADPATPDYQLAALLMAIRLNGMTPEETAQLTIAMAQTGDMLSPDVGGVPVDKHSTGGVGDTTTLVLVPLVAACGAKVVKMSGRGLGHTGGTIDKLESIPGFRTELPEEEILDIVRRVGCCVAGQTGELAPADKRLYALRDVTSTVDSMPLIAASIMSKKLAGGAQGIVLDIKTGDGALMRTLEESIRLGEAMVDIGAHAGRNVSALVTGMEEPLGSHVGNALEVKDAIDVLAGRTQGPLLEVALLLGTQMLRLAGLVQTDEEGREWLLDALESGAGLRKLQEMIQAQGGDGRVCQDTGLLPQAPVQREVRSPQSGYVQSVDALQIGLIAQGMGAGRRHKEDRIDPAVGLVLRTRIGEKVQTGEVLAVIHASTHQQAQEVEEQLLRTLHIAPQRHAKAKVLYAVISKDRTEEV